MTRKKKDKGKGSGQPLSPVTMNDLAQRADMDMIDVLEGDSYTHAQIIEQLRVGESVEATNQSLHTVHAGFGNAQRVLENYLDRLRKEGLKIGKGDSEYGYRMPIPQEDEEFRSLIIFRRR